MKIKKLTAIVAAGIMVFSLASCTNETVPPSEDIPSETAEPSESVVVSEEESEEESEVVTLVDGTKLIEDTFEDTSNSWFTYAYGGNFEMVGENGELAVKITKPGSEVYSTQIYRDGFALNQNCVYTMEFDIRSDVERDYEWRIQINGSDYHAYYIEEHAHATTEMQHVSATFTMEEESDPAPRLCFNLGAQGNIAADTPNNVYIDNVVLTITDASNAMQIAPLPEANPICVSQVGYKSADNKTVVSVNKKNTSFEIIDVATNASVYTGTFNDRLINSHSAGVIVHQGDFSDFKTPGTYYIHTESEGDTYQFTIADDIFDDVYASTVKMLYLQRCGMELTKDYAESFAHPACHTEKATIYGTSTKIDVSGGWHDAGDYGRYVVAGAKTVADLLLTYEDGNETSDALGIPESGNKVPDILDEARYELDWMLKMQASNGGVYHKVTCAAFPDTVMPEEETDELIVAPISTTATGDFAAVMAKASVIYKDYDATFATTCLDAAKKAYGYMEKNAETDKQGFKNPKEIATGEYGDKKNSDEYFWAAVELYAATGDNAYLTQAKTLYEAGILSNLGWADVGVYGIYSYLSLDASLKTDAAFTTTLTDFLKKTADGYISKTENDGYYTSLDRTFPWGSNMLVANIGMIYNMTYKVTGDAIYKDMADYQVDYLLGMNPVGYCYVTGFGEVSPKNIHHRPSQAIGEAMPGMLVGGPDNALEDPYAQGVLQNEAPGKCYVDNAASFSTNEITIYWNSPLIYLLANR